MRRLRPVGSSMDPSVQILEPELKIRLVVLPRDAIHPGGGFALQRVERRLQGIDVDVVEKRGEPLLSLPCCLSYAVQRLGHANPALRPVRALLAHVPLGPRPWLHRLRSRLPGLVRRLRRYYAGVRLLWIVHQRLRLLAFPPRTISPEGLWPIQRSPGSRTRSVRTCQGLLWIVHQRLRLLAFPPRTISPEGLWPIQRSPGSRTRSVRTCQGLRPRRARRALAISRLPILPSVK